MMKTGRMRSVAVPFSHPLPLLLPLPLPPASPVSRVLRAPPPAGGRPVQRGRQGERTGVRQRSTARGARNPPSRILEAVHQTLLTCPVWPARRVPSGVPKMLMERPAPRDLPQELDETAKPLHALMNEHMRCQWFLAQGRIKEAYNSRLKTIDQLVPAESVGIIGPVRADMDALCLCTVDQTCSPHRLVAAHVCFHTGVLRAKEARTSYLATCA